MKSKKEIKVGLFVLASILTLYLGINYLKGVDIFNSENKYYAVYDDVEGLAVSNPVIYKGVEVGNVGGISLMKNHKGVLVELYIQKKLKVSSNTRAMLISNSLMGSKAIVLDMKTPNGIPLVSGDTLKSVVEEGITEVLKSATIPLATKIDSLLSEYQGSGVVVKETLKSFQKTSMDLNKILLENQQHIKSTFSSLEAISNDLERNVMPNLKSITSKFDSVADSLKQAPVKQMVTELDKTLANVNSILKGVENGEGTLGQFVKNEKFYHNLNRSMTSLDSLLLDLRANPKRYVHFSFFGKK